MTLPSSTSGSGEPTLTLVHGFTQTRASWNPVIDLLDDRFRCVSVDAPHHGEAQSVSVQFESAADLVGASAAGSVIVGYSMGGRIALAAAIRNPSLLRGLVLVSATAGISDDASRAERRASDEKLAARIESIGTAKFLEEWTSQPMFAETTLDQQDLRGRLTNLPRSLAASLRMCGAGAQPSYWQELSTISVPTLIIAGERDKKYVQLGRDLHEGISSSEFVVIGDAGHAAHLDHPARCAEVLADFVKRRISV